MNTASNPALEREALYAKSQVYIRRGLRAQEASDTEEYQLWASFSLELLGKAGLAMVHPALVADPMHAESLFAACGRQISPNIRTITAKTLFERLRHIDKNFDSRHQKFCEQISLRRNAEIHSGESPFLGMTALAWEREFWGAVETILAMQGESLESWLGSQNAKAPVTILEQAAAATEWAVKHRITRRKEDFETEYPTEKKRKAAIEESKSRSWNDINWDGITRSQCPACGALGFIAGSIWSEDVIDTDETFFLDENGEEHPGPPVETIERIYNVEYFRCPACQLELSGTKEIAAAEIDSEFSEKEEREREFYDDYGND